MRSANKQSNPQGKGIVPLLSQWENYRPQPAAAKPAAQLLVEYFSSLLVLSAKFKFKPIPGKDYFLYLHQGDWQLSLIEPTRWSEQRRGLFLGACQLQHDMTWTVDTIDDIEQQPELMLALHTFSQNLFQQLDSDRPMQQQLPFYVATLPFYARLAATGMAKSMNDALASAGILKQPSLFFLLSVGNGH